MTAIVDAVLTEAAAVAKNVETGASVGVMSNSRRHFSANSHNIRPAQLTTIRTWRMYRFMASPVPLKCQLITGSEQPE